MTTFRSHLTVLEASLPRHASSPVFKTPRLSSSTGKIESWRSITYEQFHQHVELYARYWTRVFRGDNIAHGSVVGLWLSGFTYTDVLHIYGISRAGYIPQLFSLRLPNPVVVYELLQRAGAKALIYDISFDKILGDCCVPSHLALYTEDIEDVEEALPGFSEINGDATAFIFHTSGSTSGSPKLVPCSYRWLDIMIQKSHFICQPQNLARQDVTVFIGSMCHIAQSFMFVGALQYGSCVVQPTALSFSSEELIDMVVRCQLNRLNQFPTFLANHFRQARQDPKLLAMLRNLDDVLYSGLALPHEEEQFAYSNGIKLRNIFGSTEVGGMLLSGGCERNPALLSPIRGVSYRFVPIDNAQSQGAHHSTKTMFELVILADSPDCPDPSLRHPDGNFHTGDLFQEVAPGFYTFRGRDDDWIKSENSLRCDTKAIEDNVRAMCGNLIAECVVVGSGRPSPVMFIEPMTDMDHDKLKKDIMRKTRHFHSRRYLHERITSTEMVVVVPRHTLPRTATKGNIRRKAVEESYKSVLDGIFNCAR